MNWESALIAPDTALEDVIRAIDQSALRIAIVVDAKRRLLGTVTDGDIRRALLRHLPLTEPAREIMCNTPQTAEVGWSKERVLAVMEKKLLLQLPVVDEEGTVVGLETLHGLLDRRNVDNPVFLMAGGLGTRLHPLTNDCPKPLLKVGPKPILEQIVESFVNAGFHRFFISTHYLPEKIRDYFGDGSRWGVSIRYVHEETPLGTGGALGLLPHDEITEPMIVMNGDLLTTLNYRSLLEFHTERAGVATMCVREFEYQVPYGVVKSDGDLIQALEEKPVQRWFINAGIYVLSPDMVRSVKPNTRVDMPTLLQQQVSSGRNVVVFPVHEYWLDIGRMDDFRRAQADIGSL